MGMFDASYRRCGFQEFSKGWMHPVRTVGYNEIICVVKGVVKIFEGDKKYELHKGDCIVLEKGKRHGGYEGADKDVGFYWIEFDSDTDYIDGIKNVQFGAGETFLALARQLLHVSRIPYYTSDSFDCYVRLLLGEISVAAGKENGTAYPVCDVIAEWIRSNVSRKIEVDEVSNVFGYNKDYISRAFKKNFGLSLKSYIDTERLNYIKGLLMSTSYPLKQIAGMTGFANYKSFLKFFSYHSKQTPFEYRRRMFGKDDGASED